MPTISSLTEYVDFKLIQIVVDGQILVGYGEPCEVINARAGDYLFEVVVYDDLVGTGGQLLRILAINKIDQITARHRRLKLERHVVGQVFALEVFDVLVVGIFDLNGNILYTIVGRVEHKLYRVLYVVQLVAVYYSLGTVVEHVHFL